MLTQSTPGASHFKHPTAMAMHPDGSKLFVAQRNGKIHVITLNGAYDAVNVTRIDTIYARDPQCVYPYHPGSIPGCDGRTVTGLTFSAAGDLYVSHSDGLINNAAIDAWSGVVSKLPANTNYTTSIDIVTGLPRSKKDHGPNGLTFGPDGHLYLAQAGMTNAGWTYGTDWSVAESTNSAAIIGINVLTGQYFRYATGLRNPYEVLFHSNGKIYTNDNGPNPSSGNKPSSCSTEGLAPTEYYEELNLLQFNKYYGHPNVHQDRGECTFNGGLNYTAPITDCPGPACYGANKGATGIAEYNSPFFPEMQGEIITSLLAGSFNGGGSVVAVKLTNNGTQVASVKTLVDGLAHPIDVLARPDGSILIAEHNWNEGFGPDASVVSVLKLKHTIGTHIDSDGLSDLGVFRPSTSEWKFKFTSTGQEWMPGYWAFQGDQPYAIDWDGDGKMDKSVFRIANGQWHVRTAASYYQSGPPTETWAQYGDLPAPADYDGDGKTDLAVFRPSNGAWQIHWSKTNTNSILSYWGFSGWEPYPGFYDNDGYADLGLYNPSTGVWQIRTSTQNYMNAEPLPLGTFGDKPIPADYDNDGITDRAVWRPSNGGWYVHFSTANASWMIQSFGSPTDIPRPMDYDGDGRADLAVWRPSTGVWYIRTTRSGFDPSGDKTIQLGASGDIPLARIP